MSRSSFLYQGQQKLDPNLLSKAQEGAVLRPVVVGAGSLEAVETALMASDLGVAEAILVGKAEEYAVIAEKLGIDQGRFRFIAADSEADIVAKAIQTIHDGDADCLVKGQIHTDVYMKGILNKKDGLRDPKGGRIVHVFALFPPEGGKPVLISDGAVNPSPDSKTAQQSIKASIQLAHALGMDRPNVAVLSATESIIPSVPSSETAAELVAWAKNEQFNANIAGPLAFDAAFAPEAAAIKGLSGVAGQANIMIVPDIVSGNVLFKSFVWIGGALAAGIVLGAQVPVVLTSRADPPEARLASLILAKLMAN